MGLRAPVGGILTGQKNWNRQTSYICEREKNLEISGFLIHRAMAEEFFLKPLAIVVAKNEDQGGLKL